VSGSAEFLGEREAAGRQSLCVMEEQKLSHGGRNLSCVELDRALALQVR
jgi:hypothetical protein